MAQRQIIGIDFGTTNSKMTYMLIDEPVVIENVDGDQITPLCCFF